MFIGQVRELRFAVGEHNVRQASPEEIMGQFTPHTKGVILLIPEAHDLGDVSRFKFYERLKVFAAAPPPTLMCNEK